MYMITAIDIVYQFHENAVLFIYLIIIIILVEEKVVVKHDSS